MDSFCPLLEDLRAIEAAEHEVLRRIDDPGVFFPDFSELPYSEQLAAQERRFLAQLYREQDRSEPRRIRRAPILRFIRGGKK